MKHILLLPALFLLFSFGDIPTEKGQPPITYSVVYCVKEPGLSSTKANIELSFLKEGRKGVTDSILMSCNGIEFTVHPDGTGRSYISVVPGKNKFIFYCGIGYEEIYTDSIDIKGGHLTGIEIYFQPATINIMVDKPVIYVYPEKTQDISIKLNVAGELGFTYPKYNDGWNFSADPNGTLRMNGKEYDYLFWDAKTQLDTASTDLHSGFIVAKDSLTGFFEDQLSAMGLNPREQQDFITYWCPRMQENESNYIHFMFTEECNSIATIDVTPQPDNIFRVYMIWSDAKNIDENQLQPQKINSFSREGFTIVEWGGAEAKRLAEVL